VPEIGRREAHLRRAIRVLLRKLEHRGEEATLKQGARRSLDDHLPFKNIRVVYEADREAIDGVLDELLELVAQQNCAKVSTGGSLGK
jgi:hypothetical protein